MGLLRNVYAALAALTAAAPGHADTVTLTSATGFAVSGEFISFDGEFYRLETAQGPLAVVGLGLSCEGAACPVGAGEAFGIDAADRSTKRLATHLLRHFAAESGWSVVEEHSTIGIDSLTLSSEAGRQAEILFGPAPGSWRILRDPRNVSPRGWRDVALGFDALVPAVSIDNPVTSFTMLALRSAIAGEFADWEGLGGNEDTPVATKWVPTLEGPIFERYGLAPGTGAERYDDAADAADAIARTAGGLGLLPLSELGPAVPLVITGPCGRGALGVEPAIRSGDYPFSEAIVMRVPAGRPGPVARAFRDWLESPSIDGVVQRAGFIDLSVESVAPGRDGRQEAGGTGAAPSPAAETLSGAVRLDVSFRFEDGSSLPDRSAGLQIDRIARTIAAGAFDGARLIFAGFSDANGPQSANLTLSRQRAMAILNAVRVAAGEDGRSVDLVAEGFGEAMPVACNGSDWGESLNRRVEVWLVEGA